MMNGRAWGNEFSVERGARGGMSLLSNGASGVRVMGAEPPR